jgi:hypothetical protein
MNRRSILTKTGKGLMEATGKTNDLSRLLRNILKEIDGKVSVKELLDKFEKISEPQLLEALSEMERDGYVREFVGKQQDAPRQPAGRASAPQSSTDADDLDFTAFTPAKPSAKASEESRLQAQAQEIARQAQATRAREAAAAKARAEVAARAKAEADLKARQQAAPAKPASSAPVVGILGAGPDAQARAQADALERARREADERQRREADEQARRDAEARAKADAETALKRDADARALREIQERTKREEAEKARRDGEARAKLEAEQRVKREAEDRLRREMEERARREIEERMRREEAERARREEEERGRKEVERKARIESEARAKVEAELRARREAEERVRREEEERKQAQIRKRAEEEESKRREEEAAEALERAVQEEQERAEREAEEKAQREAEEHERREEGELRQREEEEERREEEKKRAKAEAKRAREEEKARAKEAKARKAERAREIAGEEAWRGDEEALRDSGEGALSAAEVWHKRRPRTFAKSLAAMLLMLVIVGLAVLPFVPLETAAYEKAAQAWLGQPVKIGSVNLTLLPLPQLKFGNVVIGKDPQLKIGLVRASPEITSLLEERASLKTLELENVTLPKEFLGAMLQERGGRRSLGVQRITAKGLKLDAPELALPPLDLDASLVDGALKSVSLTGAGGLEVKLEPRGGRATIEISAAAFPLPVGVDLGFSDFAGKGTVTRSELVLSSAEARVFGGRVLGSARLRWGSGWSLDGELTARQMDAAKIAGPLLASGTLAGKAQYSMRGLLPERMVLNRQFDGSFTIQKGVVNNVDMTRVLQGSGSGGGTTPFTELTGNVSADSNRLLVRQIRLAAGLLSAGGQLDMDLDKNLSGRMQIDLRAQSVQARATVAVSGTLTNPLFRRTN